MKIIERSNIDVDKWNSLVEGTPNSSFFSYSWYMDSVAENWAVLIDDDYSKGIALPYSKRAGIEVLYSPIFGRYSELLGDLKIEELTQIKDRFKIVEFACRQAVFNSSEERINQVIEDFDNHKLGSQAKRSIKKAEKNGLKITKNAEIGSVFKAVKDELEDKHSGINATTLKSLKTLFQATLEEGKLRAFNVEGEINHGGIICFESDSQLLYVKGAVDSETKVNGGMYLALNSAIEYAKLKGLKFDFGGSNAEGVKRFNHNLGGVDETYYMHIENNGPAWFKLARKIKTRLIGN